MNEYSAFQVIVRILLGAFMLYAGIGHFTHLHSEFRAQVPRWLATNPKWIDAVVLISGFIEIVLGLSMIFWSSQFVNTGFALATFFTLIFPGNIAQYKNHKPEFGLDTDIKRFIRLLFQPLLIFLALWSTGALKVLVKYFY